VHIPDGFINAPTSLAAGAVAAGGVGVGLRRAAQTLQERQAPLAGLVAAYIFAVQMLNFPVAAGTSGHLLGGVLAAVLVGPWAGCICVAVVLVVQSLFADGGLTALGLNITNMAVLGVLGGWAVFRLLRRALPASKPSVVVSSGIAAGISVVLAAAAFVLEYALGGAGGAPVGTVLAAMVGVHTLIGIGEGIITALTVGVVLGVRPDLVYGAQDFQAPLALSTRPEPAPGEVG
jgi:cobalt/nickel transport system permease protein